VHRSDVGDSPYVKTISKETPETFTFFWGTETEGSKNTHLNGLVRTADHAMANAIYPADRGIFSVSLRDVEAGQVGQHGETPALPLVQIEASRRSPKTYSFGHVDHGVNLAGRLTIYSLSRGRRQDGDRPSRHVVGYRDHQAQCNGRGGGYLGPIFSAVSSLLNGNRWANTSRRF